MQTRATVIVSWGSTAGAVRDAVKELRKNGHSVSALHLPQVWPLPEEELLKHLEAADRVVCVEGNATGQLARLIRRETGFNIEERVLRYDGRPITHEYILRKLDGEEKGQRHMVTENDYGNFETAWCPGCGNFSIRKAVKNALVALELEPHEVLFVAGIGQAAKAPHYLEEPNVFNGLHGRALPVATGAKLVNPDMPGDRGERRRLRLCRRRESLPCRHPP